MIDCEILVNRQTPAIWYRVHTLEKVCCNPKPLTPAPSWGVPNTPPTKKFLRFEFFFSFTMIDCEMLVHRQTPAIWYRVYPLEKVWRVTWCELRHTKMRFRGGLAKKFFFEIWDFFFYSLRKRNHSYYQPEARLCISINKDCSAKIRLKIAACARDSVGCVCRLSS